ncbi:DUF2256 domain-containing protein [Pelagibacteraceae bacterium]|nr:DUF2256 domain-containing protein [Pelagibacteraceae bacterium]
MTYRKTNLPKKNCVNCGLSFAWRKKWERCWNEVQYCSKKCAGSKKAPKI